MDDSYVSLLGNLSAALIPVQRLVSGLGYIVGILFFIHGLLKLKDTMESRHSQETPFIPLAYMLAGAALIYLPTSITVLTNTTFGTGNALQYAPVDKLNIYDVVSTIVSTVGLIWFIRGCVLLAHASEPQEKGGPKGLAFVFAGILGMHINTTVSVINSMLNYLIAATSVAKNFAGY